jgi:hypothetical protein
MPTNSTVSPSVVRPLCDIAHEIMRKWRKSVCGTNLNYAAEPHLAAMASLESMSDSYGSDDARSVVAYFLSNASSWRGEDARRIKAELNAMLKASR